MAEVLYAGKGAGATTSDLYTLNSGTAAPSSIGASGFALTGLAANPADGTLWGVTSAGSGASPRQLVTVNVSTGAATLVGALGGTISDIAFDSAGNLYGWAPASGTLPAGFGLCTINKSTGAATLVGTGSNIGGNSGGLAFSSLDVLYVLLTVSASTRLYTANVSTGVLTLVGNTFVGGNPNAATFDAANLLWWLRGGGGVTTELHTLDVGTLTDTMIGTPGGTDYDALGWSVTVAAPGDPPVGVGGVRVAVAFDDPTLEPSPTWTYLTATDNLVAGYTIDAGRQFEFDKTDTSTCVITINDPDGLLDPTNTLGPYYGKIEPLLQVQVELYNPVAATWHRRFRGFVEDYDYSIDPSQVVTRLQISCVDLFAILTAIEMQPGEFGDTPPTGAEGNVFFDNASASDRIAQVMGNAGIPTDFYVVFTLNVDMQESTYSPGENALQVVQDAADAEGPTVSNVYVDRTGRVAVHGRFAKFDPITTAAFAAPGQWLFTHWQAGDGDAVLAAPSVTAHIRTLSFNRGLSKVFNSCLCTPNKIADTAIAGQLVKDLTSIGDFGIRSWSAENLLIDTGTTTGNTGLQETKAWATFVKEQYKQPRNRVSELTFRSISPVAAGAGATWALLCEADVSDLIDLTEISPGGGGFTAETFFIEGRHEEAKPLNGTYADVTLSLDLSPGDIFIGHGSGTGYDLDG